MSDTNTSTRPPAPTRTETILVEKANDGGLMSKNGQWFNYGRIFKKQDRPQRDSVLGKLVELTLVQAQEGKWFVRSLRPMAETQPATAPKAPAEAPAPAADAPVKATATDAKSVETKPAEPSLETAHKAAPADGNPDAASPEALKYAEDLALQTGISSELLEKITQLRFNKPFAALTMSEASKTIVYFGGYQRDRARSFSKRS